MSVKLNILPAVRVPQPSPSSLPASPSTSWARTTPGVEHLHELEDPLRRALPSDRLSIHVEVEVSVRLRVEELDPAPAHQCFTTGSPWKPTAKLLV